MTALYNLDQVAAHGRSCFNAGLFRLIATALCNKKVPQTDAGLFYQNESLVMMNNGVISKLSNFGRRRSVL
jgi:hypothetical protein